MAQKDNYGFFGPDYSYADNIALPGSIGVRQEASFDAIIDSASGVNYYMDVIAFGGPSLIDTHNPQPMGVRYYLNTEQSCSNGATMSDYFDGVTKGDLLGNRVAAGLASAGLPGLKGLLPGMMENARDALDPRPILSAVTATGYPVCQQVACPVGDVNGGIQDPTDPTIQYLADPVDTYINGLPQQLRWVQAYDADGNPMTITKDEYGATPKCYNPDGSYTAKPPTGCGATEAAPQSQPGTGRYGLCQVVQPATTSVEGFADMTSPTGSVMLGLSVALLLGVGIWSLCRK
jgi:hypothetical protein